MPKSTKPKAVKAAKSATKRTKRPIVFVNNKGNVMHLKGSLTLTDLTKPTPHKFTVTVRGPKIRAVAKNRLMLALARRQTDGSEFNVSNPRTKLSRKQVAEFLRNEMAGAGASYAAPFYAIVIQYLEEAK